MLPGGSGYLLGVLSALQRSVSVIASVGARERIPTQSLQPRGSHRGAFFVKKTRKSGKEKPRTGGERGFPYCYSARLSREGGAPPNLCVLNAIEASRVPKRLGAARCSTDAPCQPASAHGPQTASGPFS